MKDIQSQKDTRHVEIQKVGVRNVHIPMIIPEKSGSIQNVSAEVELNASLSSDMRGTHMSRFMEILNKYSKITLSYESLKNILSETKEALKSSSVSMNIKFRYYIEKQAPISLKKGLIDYICGFKASLDENFKTILHLEIPIITLCPCSKEISEYGAHNQRAYVKINIEYDRDDVLWFEDLTHDIEKLASGELYSILKRPDEKAVTERAYDNPKFVEDIVRDTAIYLKQAEGTINFDVECESEESIHNHNSFAYVNFGIY